MSQPHYVFSVGRHVIDQRPYRDGSVYLLPRQGFVAEPPIPFGPLLVHTAQLAGLHPIRPLAELALTADDFPFLAQMLAHDDERLAVYAEAMQQGAPGPRHDRPRISRPCGIIRHPLKSRRPRRWYDIS